MIRTVPVLAVSALVAFAPLAHAQRSGGHGGGHGGRGGFSMAPLPLSPGVFPGSSIGPGTQFLPQPTPRFVPGPGIGGGSTQYLRSGATLPYFGQGASFNRSGFGYGYGYSFGSSIYGGYGYGYGDPDFSYGPTVVFAPPVTPSVALANEFPAVLTVQLPVGDNPKEYSLTSPVLKPGEEYTFAVDVRWTSGGKTYEARRNVKLGAGAKSRLLIVSGDEVKE